MEDIIIEKTSKTPTVNFNFEENYLEISGVSIPEDAESFYEPLMQWVMDYIENKKGEKTKFILRLIYFNTSTADYLVNMLKSLKQLKDGYEEEEDNELSQQAQDSLDKAALASEQHFLELKKEEEDHHKNGQDKYKEENEDEEDEDEFENDEIEIDHPLQVEWHYEEEDEDMRETGTHFESIIDLPFSFKAVNEIE